MKAYERVDTFLPKRASDVKLQFVRLAKAVEIGALVGDVQLVRARNICVCSVRTFVAAPL